MTLYAWYYSNKNSTIYTRTSTPSIEDTLYDSTGATITRSILSVASDYSYIKDDKWNEQHLRDSSKDIIEAQYISNLSDGTNTYVIKDAEARTGLASKQDTLVSGTNIKTVNNTSLLGSGNVSVGTVTSVNNVSPVNGNVTLSIPAAQIQSDWTQSDNTKLDYIKNKPNLATVATTGAYSDLSGTPTIPTVNDATLTITQGGTTKGTFTANASSNVTIDLDSGGTVDVDNSTITLNSSDQIQTVAVKDNNNNAIKTWTGTRQQYDSITTKDSNTLYNITDDTDVTLTLLNTLYPVGAIYIGTMNACPLQVLGVGTWQLVSSGRVLQGVSSGQTTGTTVEAGLPNITGSFEATRGLSRDGMTTTGAFSAYVSGTSEQSTTFTGYGNSENNVTFNASDSNSIYGNSSTVQPPAYLVNIWERIQ